MKDYKYLKFNVDDISQSMVFFEYTPKIEGEKNKLVTRAIPLSKLLEVEQKLSEYLEGDTVGIYFEERPNSLVSEKHYEDFMEPLEEEMYDYVRELTKRACFDKEFDELLKPPSIDEQVEDFIKEFFTDEDSEDIEQKDFLEDFFSELEEEAEDQPLETSKPTSRSLHKEFDDEFNNKTATSRDFLAEFFAEIEEDDK
tara:strand:+ start:8751 stop:9344 length:594 start_codon:yes stop_codon:yes gene_type:complete